MISMADTFFRFEGSNVLFVHYDYFTSDKSVRNLYICWKNKPKKGETGRYLDKLLKNVTLKNVKFAEENYLKPKMLVDYITIDIIPGDERYKKDDLIYNEIKSVLKDNGIEFIVDKSTKKFSTLAFNLSKTITLGDPDFTEPKLDKKIIALLDKAVKDKLIYKPQYGYFAVNEKPKTIGSSSKIYHMYKNSYTANYIAPGFISGMENGVRNKEVFCAGSGPTNFYSMDDGDLFVNNYKKFKALANKLQKLGLEVYCNIWMDGGYRLACYKK